MKTESQHLYIKWNEKKAGYQNESGVWKIHPEYDDAYPFSNGLALVNKQSFNRPNVGFINSHGDLVIPTKFYSASYFSCNGLAAVRENYIGGWGYTDNNGSIKIPCQFSAAYDFATNGLAMVEDGNNSGFINTEGDLVIPFKYTSMNAWNVNFKIGFSDIGLALISEKRDDGSYKSGFINSKDERVVPLIYDYAESFSKNGLALVRSDDKYGYVNPEGNVVIPMEYDYAKSFSENGLALVQSDDKYGYINSEGDVVIPIEYGYATEFGCFNLAYVSNSGNGMYINSNNDCVINLPSIDYANNFAENGLAKIKKEYNKVGFIDTEGNFIIEPRYLNASDFCVNGLALVRSKGGFLREDPIFFIDENGEKVKNHKRSGILDRHYYF